MALRYGIPKVDSERRICYNCQHFMVDIDPHSGWGECELANTKMFRHRLRDGVTYYARHSKARMYNQKGCKIRFKAVNENAEI